MFVMVAYSCSSSYWAIYNVAAAVLLVVIVSLFCSMLEVVDVERIVVGDMEKCWLVLSGRRES